MRSVLRQLAPFAAILAVLYAGGYVAGTIIDADAGGGGGHAMGGGEKAPAHAEEQGGHAEEQGGHAEEQGGHEVEAEAEAPHGDELRLALDRARFTAGERQQLAFRIEDADGNAVRDFDLEHERRMHVIVVRSDLTGFQHIHPRLRDDGTWTVPLTLGAAGTYRVFADFSTGGESATLDADVHVPGDFAPRELPHPEPVSRSGDYDVELAGRGDDVRFTVRRGGRVLDDLQPYLGARGHLVALREGDLSFLHVHPKDDATAGRDIRFGVEYPSNGRYRLFLQFKHDGRVQTAAFTQEVGGHGHDD